MKVKIISAFVTSISFVVLIYVLLNKKNTSHFQYKNTSTDTHLDIDIRSEKISHNPRKNAADYVENNTLLDGSKNPYKIAVLRKLNEEEFLLINNHTYGYIDVENVFGFWNLKLIDMYNDKFFNINWAHYKMIAERDFNISESEFTWDIVDDILSDYMIEKDTQIKNKNTIHEFNNLKKNYYNWINVPNDNTRYYWDIKLSMIDKDTNFQKIWNWAVIMNGARFVLANQSSEIDWNLVDQKIFNYTCEKNVYYNNIYFKSDLKIDEYIQMILTIKEKYKDYSFLMKSKFYFYDISVDKDFQRTIAWEKVENVIKRLLKTNASEELNMTLVDLKIKEYEFNNRNFTKRENIMIKYLIQIERQYSDYLNKINGFKNNNSTSNGLMSDIGNNIHQGTIAISLLANLGESLKQQCSNECLDNCQKRYQVHQSKKSLFACVSIVCLCDEFRYHNLTGFNFTNKDIILHTYKSNYFYYFFVFMFILSLVLLLIFYEFNKESELFMCMTRNELSDDDDDDDVERPEIAKKVTEKIYDYILLNEH